MCWPGSPPGLLEGTAAVSCLPAPLQFSHFPGRLLLAPPLLLPPPEPRQHQESCGAPTAPAASTTHSFPRTCAAQPGRSLAPTPFGTQLHGAKRGFIFMLIFKMVFSVKAWFRWLDQAIAKGGALPRKPRCCHLQLELLCPEPAAFHCPEKKCATVA